ncbi:nucleotidyl transferase AbiEii/AbiGii toxin family protein [Thermodesulfobacteriota bacterium]
MLNEDYRDMLHVLSEEKVKFILVGAYALAAHGYPRATMDIDIWVMPSPENADAVLRALSRFGAPLHNLTQEDLLKDGTIFQIGVAPRRIDIITTASGLQFETSYQNSIPINIEGIEVRIPSIDDLILNKRAIGRTKDLADAEALESLKNSEIGRVIVRVTDKSCVR